MSSGVLGTAYTPSKDGLYEIRDTVLLVPEDLRV